MASSILLTATHKNQPITDRNNTIIRDGDILLLNDEFFSIRWQGKARKGVAVWSDGDWYLKKLDNDSLFKNLYCISISTKVVGNIYED